jgi:hypothetical protein
MPWDANLYLVAHKMLGEPTLDVAVKIETGTSTDSGPWWITPTTGHRLYPYWTRRIGDLFAYTNIGLPPAGLRDAHETFVRELAAAKRPSAISAPRPEDL